MTSAVYPDVLGGHAVHCHELSLRQVEQGHKVTVLTWRRERFKPHQEIVGSRYLVMRLNNVWMPWDSLGMTNPFLPALSKTIRQLDFDLIHAHSHLFWTTVTAVKIAKATRRPVIITVHGVSAERNSLVNLAQYSYLYTFGSWVFRNSTRTICLTNSDATEITRFGANPEKIRVVPNAVDTDLFKPGEDNGNHLVWVGRFVPEKGLQYLVKAAKIVLSEHHDVKFVLVGDGPLKPCIMNLAIKNGLKERICFAGKMSQREVVQVMQSASVFLLPSLKEGFPKTLLEAMACGKPVIASNISGVNEIIEDGYNGLLVPPREPRLMADAIIELSNDKDLSHKLGQQARLSVLKRYNWDLVIDKIEKVYCEAIEETK